LKDVYGYVTLENFISHVCRPHMCVALSELSVDTTLVVAQLYNNCGVQWIARSVIQLRKTCVADALFLCGSWVSCNALFLI